MCCDFNELELRKQCNIIKVISNTKFYSCSQKPSPCLDLLLAANCMSAQIRKCKCFWDFEVSKMSVKGALCSNQVVSD